MAGAVLAFLKRRWILLSCAAVLLLCSFFDAMGINKGTLRDQRPGLRNYGLSDGTFFFYEQFASLKNPIFVVRSAVHFPRFGRDPSFIRGKNEVTIHCLLWLPLSFALGWLAWRDLRCREKRAKAAEQP